MLPGRSLFVRRTMIFRMAFHLFSAGNLQKNPRQGEPKRIHSAGDEAFKVCMPAVPPRFVCSSDGRIGPDSFPVSRICALFSGFFSGFSESFSESFHKKIPCSSGNSFAKILLRRYSPFPVLASGNSHPAQDLRTSARSFLGIPTNSRQLTYAFTSCHTRQTPLRLSTLQPL